MEIEVFFSNNRFRKGKDPGIKKYDEGSEMKFRHELLVEK